MNPEDFDFDVFHRPFVGPNQPSVRELEIRWRRTGALAARKLWLGWSDGAESDWGLQPGREQVDRDPSLTDEEVEALIAHGIRALKL
ncbi:MAG: hypothetical protein U0271_34180 [Polyangiaceae bacterium]